MRSASGGQPKQFLQWKDRPLYWHSALVMARAGLDGAVVAFPQERLEELREELQSLIEADMPGIPFVAAGGGERRQDSVFNALKNLPLECTHVLIHDAARPFASPGLVRSIIDSLSFDVKAVIPGIPLSDTIKLVCGSGRELVRRTLPREELRAVQTPQGFEADFLRNAHEQARKTNLAVTDDAMLIEHMGGSVAVIPGEAENIKITHPQDLDKLAEPAPALPCSGMGYDVHRFGGDRPLRLGGVPIPGDYAVKAHSDGDVLLHAVMDGLLGMAALGDIGRHFPDTAAEYAGMDSSIMLAHVMDLLKKRGIDLCHLDMTVVAQKPRLAPYADQIRRNVARLLALSEDAVNFKATTEEKLGFTGACEGIKAYALASGIKRLIPGRRTAK